MQRVVATLRSCNGLAPTVHHGTIIRTCVLLAVVNSRAYNGPMPTDALGPPRSAWRPFNIINLTFWSGLIAWDWSDKCDLLECPLFCFLFDPMKCQVRVEDQVLLDVVNVVVCVNSIPSPGYGGGKGMFDVA